MAAAPSTSHAGMGLRGAGSTQPALSTGITARGEKATPFGRSSTAAPALLVPILSPPSSALSHSFSFQVTDDSSLFLPHDFTQALPESKALPKLR